MTDRIQIIRHEVVPKCGSCEVRFPDGRPSKYFYWEDIPGRRLRSEQANSKQAPRRGQGFRAGRRRSRLQEQRRFQIDHRRHQGGSAWQEPR